MKKFFTFLTALALVFCLSACDKAVQVKDINEGLDEFEFDAIDESNQNLNQPELSVEEKALALTADEQRVQAVAKIQEALAKYLADNASYPETKENLIPDYLEAWPQDPGEFEYIYTPIGALPAKFYDLSYELEVGFGELIAGVQVASPEEIAK